jgi:phage recombination protein Bet
VTARDLSLEEKLRLSVYQARAKRIQRMTEQSIVIHRDVSGPLEFSEEQVQLLRDGYAPGATPIEFRMLLEVARLRRLNPFLKQIHFVKRRSKDRNDNWVETWTSQVSIDGLRAIAQRTGLYDGQDEPTFERDKDGLILSARVAVYRKDWSRAAVGVARWEEYVQTTRDGKPTKFWDTMPHVMIAKCAEALALRKAFPEDCGDLYTDEEMQQADNTSKLDNGSSGALNPHEASPDANPANVDRDRYAYAMKTMRECDKAIFDPGCTWETLQHWRGIMGSKGAPSELGKEMSAMYRGDLSEGDRKELSALWNRVDRKLTALEGKLKAPSVEASFVDEPDGTEALGAPERQPGEDEDEL